MDINRDSIGGIDGVDITKEYVSWFPTKEQLRGENAIEEYVLKGWLPNAPFIQKNSRIIAFGSCFVQNVIRFLSEKKYCVNDGSSKFYFYTAEYISTFAIKEQLEWILGRLDVDNIEWFRGKDYVKDKKIVLNDEEREKVFKDFSKADVIILNPGIIEIWQNRNTGRSLWRKSLKDQDGEEFKISTFSENKDNLIEIYNCLRELNKDCKIILVANPVSMSATFRGESSISADMVSKSILRGVIDEFYREHKLQDDNIYYWPSSEIFQYCIGEEAYSIDGRHVTEYAIKFVMKIFSKYYLEP